MAEKRNIPMRQLGGDVPEALIVDFDEAVEELGFVKKRALAAAVSAFVAADRLALASGLRYVNVAQAARG